ncbi:MAG: hypothetical protein Q8N91_05015 [Candidatus Omnitrophota bacterium]|nr:hypothetical protein [Candidatus Omnitrophota bacterium]
MNKAIARIKKEFVEVLPAFIFFVIMFHVLVITRALTLKAYGITTHATAIAVIGALVVAKAILIADKLPFLNLYPKKPLVWNAVLKTIVFGAITFLFLFIEELLHQSRQYGNAAAGYEHLKTDVVWPAFWAREIWLTVLLLFYCSAVELARVIGADRVKEIFFGPVKRKDGAA